MKFDASAGLKRLVKRLLRPVLLRRMAEACRREAGGGLKIIFGRHWARQPGWLILSEEEQDITKPLTFADGSADAVFTEHVLEHVSFLEGAAFMREALRVLKKGGVFRVVCPVTEKLLAFTASGDRDREYLRCLERQFKAENELFAQFGFDGLKEFDKVFLLNSVFTGHGHKFIWSAALIERVLKALGYSEVRIYPPGEGSRPEYCLERRRRGIYLGSDPAEDRAPGWVYDAESMAVEAVK